MVCLLRGTTIKQYEMTIEFAQLNTVVRPVKGISFLILTLRLGGVICDLTLEWETGSGICYSDSS